MFEISIICSNKQCLVSDSQSQVRIYARDVVNLHSNSPKTIIMTKWTWRHTLIIGILSAIMAGGCRDSAPDASLIRLEEMGEKNPNEAYDSLVAMEKDDLPKEDRMYYDFLSVKLADKAFIRHRSDSVILSVMDYYSHHGNHDLYTEVLYYGGRVYSDIGDYPTALRYFGDALDRIKDINNQQVLKGKILAQTAGLLKALRLYDEAQRYIKMSIEIDKELKDTLNLMYDLEVLGQNSLNSKKYDSAEQDFRQAVSIADKINTSRALIYRVYLAGIKNYRMRPDSAVILLKDIPYRADKLLHNQDDAKQLVYSMTADIYRCAGMPDSAYKYALELIKIKDARNLRKGYAILLSDALKDVVPLDSIRGYADRYETLTEKYMNSNGDRSALIQNSLYNYSVVERDKEKALEKKREVERWLTVSVMLLLVLTSVVLYYRNRSNKTRLELHQALERWHSLAEQLDRKQNEAQKQNKTEEQVNAEEQARTMEQNKEPTANGPSGDVESVGSLRDRLANELNSLCRTRKNRKPLSPVIAESKAYATLMTCVAEDRAVPGSSPLWEELHRVVSKASPDFDKRVQLLSGGKVKEIDLRIMLLIKCGVTPSQLCTLVAKSKATLSYHRKMLGLQWLDNDLDPRLIDNLIYDL